MSHRDVDVVVRAPALAGRYRLRVVMVQEHVRWVDTTEPEAFLEVVLEVESPRPDDLKRMTREVSDSCPSAGHTGVFTS